MLKKFKPHFSTFILIGTLSCSQLQKTKDSNSEYNHSNHFDSIPFVGNFKAKRAILKNGLRLIVVRDNSSPTFAYQTWFNVGSRNEIFGKTGLAHFFEHLMFKGTSNHPEGEFDALLEKAGAEGENAFTGTDHTAYVQELPKDKLDLIISLESDRMTHLLVNEQSFKTEREVVQNERRFRKENSAEGIIYESMFELAYQNHPYHWPVIGYEQDLNMMTAQDARDFYERYYSPDRATVVVVGDVDEDEVLEKVEKAYGSIPAKNTPDGTITPEPEQTAQRRKKIHLNIQIEKLWMTFKTPPYVSPESAAFEVIQGLLTDGMDSRLDHALVDSGIAASVSTGSFSLKDPGLFSITVDLQKGKSANLAEAVILRELERLKNTLVKEAELNRAKNIMRFKFLERLSTSNGKAHFIGENDTLYGDFQKGLQFESSLQKVTANEIQEVAKRFFISSKLNVIIGVPKSIQH